MTDMDRIDLALLIVRTGVGLTIAAHGTQKLFGWFGGKGLTGSGQIFSSMGFEPGKRNALAAGVGETVGGALMAFGIATPVAAAAAASTMAGATASSSKKGFWAISGGYEYPAVLTLTAAGIAISGPGRYSVDALLGDVFNQSWMAGVSLGGAAVAITIVLLRRNAELKRRDSDAARETASTT